MGPGIAVMAAIGALAVSLEAAASITLAPVLTALSNPVLVTNARDGSHRLFVVEQAGVIKVLPLGGTSPTVFLDISSRVLSGGEQGLLGLTFHPQFSSNRRFFVNYTRQTDGATVIAEYRTSPSDPNIADPTETVFLVIPQPFANHNGGMVEFGPDGFLYIGMGDGGSGNDPGNRAQDKNQLLGKMLRIDVDQPDPPRLYSSPPTNPFFGATAGADEIYAYGLRNPWRFSFDRGTGDLYAGDVGQGAVEEVDIITLGGNYGWRIWEGSTCTGIDPCNPAGVTFPIAEYGHTGGRCSVTGGYVYRGVQSSLAVGSYVYADFCTGEIFILQNGTSSVALDTTLNISSFGEDESGELYVVGLGGTVHRIANTTPPAPDLTINKTHSGIFAKGQVGATYTLTVSNVATAATAGTVTVTDTLPTGLTATALGGSGWSCTLGTLTCTRGDALTNGSYPAITLTVNVASNAPNSVTNTATVSGGGDANPGNNTVNDPTSITIFADIPTSHPFFTWIEALAKAGITGGCSTSPPQYCPDSGVTRAQMAVFLLRGIHGAGYQPPAATGTMFTDVPVSQPFATWIEQLAREGITAGCSTSPPQYCPDATATRGQMAVLLLRAKHGAGYQPPAATGTMFTDVPVSQPFATWIEQLAREGITGGCSTSPPQYCPDATVTRGQMAVFLVRTFQLPL